MNAKVAIQHTALYLKRGSSWISNTTNYAMLLVYTPNIRIAAYGSGAKPLITANVHTAVYMGNNWSYSDIVFSNIQLVVGPSSDGYPFTLDQSSSLYISHIYFDNMDFINNSSNVKGGCLWRAFNAAGILGSTAFIGCGLWNCTGTNPNQLQSGTNFGASKWFFIYGLTLIGDTFAHHINNEGVQSHAVYRWVKTLGTIESTFYSFALSCRALKYSGVDGECQLATECFFDGGVDGVAVDPVNQRTGGILHSFIVERCSFTGLLRNVFYPTAAATVTCRDNLIWNCDGGSWGTHLNPGTTEASILKWNHYRNKHYRAGNNRVPIINLYTNTATCTQPWQITDNSFFDTRTGSNQNVIGLMSADQTAAGSLIDRNQYWAPSDGNAKFFNDNGVMKSFAQWQAAGFDRNGRVANPNWPDPANGRF
jgi:hypothetical protein